MLSDYSYRANVSPDDAFPFTMFTIRKESCTPPGPGYHYLHWHEDLQFTLVTKGHLILHVDGNAHELYTRDAVFINSGYLHMTSNLSTGGEYISFNFPSRFLSFFFGSNIEQNYVLPFTSNYRFPSKLFRSKNGWEEILIQKLEQLASLYSSDIYARDYEITLKASEIWLYMIRHLKDGLPSPNHMVIRNQEKMQSMLSFIHNNYDKDISLNDIAASAHVSTGECCRAFKKVLHITPYGYLLQFRILKSADLLKETNLTVSEIAGATGFNDSSHFIQLFRRQMHQTPGAYRLQFLL